jgi:hypothetical protein
LARLLGPHGRVEVVVTYHGVQEPRIYIEYVGAVEDLVAAGVATDEMLARGKPGKSRRYFDGRKLHVDYRKGWIWLRLHDKPLERAMQLPGVTGELVCRAWEEHSEWLAKEREIHGRKSLSDTPSRARPSYLRLVVDNTHAS